MPVEDGAPIEVANHASAADIGQVDWSPTDFLFRTGIDLCSERPGDELGAEAYAEGRASDRQTVAEDANLVCEKGILCLLVGANWSAEDNEKVWFDRINLRQVMQTGVVAAYPIAGFFDGSREASQILERDVADRNSGLLGHRWLSGK